jgi:short-subunit dehydrogenase
MPMNGQPLTGYALITGASSGIGAAFGRRLAAEGRDLVLVARDAARLEAVATELRERYLVDVEVLPADLTTDDGCAAVAARLGQPDRPVDTLVNNAGIGLYAGFGVATIEDEERQLDLNIRAVLRLTRVAAAAMKDRGHGEIINISSVAGFVPRGAAATYGASKAWVTAFTEGLALRLAGTGVTVSAICPGFTHTEFHQRAQVDMSDVPRWMWLQADEVVAAGLADVRAGKIISVPSARYRAIVTLVRVLPRNLVRRVMARR